MQVTLGSVLLGTLDFLLGVLLVLHYCLEKLLGIFPGHLVGTRPGLLVLGVLLVLVLLGLLLLLPVLLEIADDLASPVPADLEAAPEWKAKYTEMRRP